SASTKILIEMAGHLAVGGDGTGVSWGAGLGSSSISGGSYHFSLDLLDQGSLGNLDNQIQGAAIAAPTNARSVVTNQARGGSGSLTFSAGGGIRTFTLVMPTGGVTTTAFTVNVPATVTVSEFASAGFSSSGGCPGASVTLTTPGSSGSCAFTNQAVANLTVSKQTNGGGGSFTFSAGGGIGTFTLIMPTDAAATTSHTVLVLPHLPV